MSLNNIVIEQIKDNYYRGEFLGLDLVIDKNTGYFNATKLCKAGNKQFSHWYCLKKTKELLKYVSKIQHPRDPEGVESYEVKIGTKSNPSKKEIAGTYVCKELILDIASWISSEFYLKCNKIIVSHAEEEFKKKYETKIKESEIAELCKIIKETEIKREQDRIKHDKEREEDKIQREQDRIKHDQEREQDKLRYEQDLNRHTKEREEDAIRHEEVIDNLYEVKDKLDRSLPDRNIDPEDDELVHYYILLKNKQNTNEYRLLRGQDKHIELMKKKFTNSFDVILEKTKNPNPIDFANRLKETIKIINEKTYAVTLKDVRCSTEYSKGTPTQKRMLITNAKKEHSRIIYISNKITLNNFNENDLLKLVNDLNHDKYNI